MMSLPRFEIHVHENPDALASAVAAFAQRLIAEGIAQRGSFALALSGGSTQAPFHRALARSAVDFSRVKLFFADERAVEAQHVHSNFRAVTASCLAQVPGPGPQVFRIEADDGDANRAAQDYERSLVGALGPGPVLDLVVLGVGGDGHTASLFPGSPKSMDLSGPSVIATEAPQTSPVRNRVSLSYGTLARARELFVLITGQEKAPVLARLLRGSGLLPIDRVLECRGPRSHLFVDRDAVRLVTQGGAA